ncbi:MAG: SDR family oxidoreductase [Coriobacteriia bacterium]
MLAEDYSSLFSCKEKVAVVVGSGGLIGREVCAGLRAAGADVWDADIDAQAGASWTVRMDIADEASVNTALDEVLGVSGQIDVVVNCAYPRTADWGADVEDVSIESWTQNLDAQLGGSFVLFRAAALRMKEHGGSVISLSSIYGLVGPSWEVYDGTTMTMPSAYSAIKAGLLGLTRFMATRYAQQDVRFNTVSPGGVHDAQPERFVEQYEALTPLGRMAEPRDIVGAVVFLASNGSAYITGQDIVVDGGWTAR